MKIITKKEQIIPGMIVNTYDKSGYMKLADVEILDKFIDLCKKEIELGNIIYELVSYPERRQLTWESAKELVDEWPIDVYGINGYGLMLRANRMCFDTSFGIYDWSEGIELYIDLPHPVVEDVTPPWEVEKTEEDPWVEIIPQTKVKLPCYAFVRNHETGKWYASELHGINSLFTNPFKANEMCWKYAKVRKSSIIEEPVQPTEPDDKIKRLWWYKLNTGAIWPTPYALTEKEFIRGNHFSYAPGPVVPDESEWKEVK